MWERIDAYKELKYTAKNCGIESNHIPFLIKYVQSSLEQRRILRNQAIQNKSITWAIPIVLTLSRINDKTLEILENHISRVIERDEYSYIDSYYRFIDHFDNDEDSKIRLIEFMEDVRKKFLLIPLEPKYKEMECIALNHRELWNKFGIKKRIDATIHFLTYHPNVYLATRWRFIIREDTPFLRSQIEQIPHTTQH